MKASLVALVGLFIIGGGLYGIIQSDIDRQTISTFTCLSAGVVDRTCEVHQDTREPGSNYYWECTYNITYSFNGTNHSSTYHREYYKIPGNQSTVGICLTRRGHLVDKEAHIVTVQVDYAVGAVVLLVGICCVIFTVIDRLERERREYTRLI